MQQPPILNLLPGALSDGEAAAQERAAWGRLARACEEALTELSPSHPERGAFVEMWAECRRAAGLPLEPSVSLTGSAA